MKVLLFDNDAESVPRLRNELESRGHRVTALAPPLEPQQVGDAGGFDAIIADAALAHQTRLLEIVPRASHAQVVLLGSAPPDAGFEPAGFTGLARPIDVARISSLLDEARAPAGHPVREPLDLLTFDALSAGGSTAARDLLARIDLIAKNDGSVFVVGEEGTGREVVARAIHQRSARGREPFVAVRSAGFSAEQLRERLFGQDSAIARAGTGTLFLDSLETASLEVQRELHRVIRERALESAGATPARFRLIAAAGADYLRAREQGRLLAELYFNISVLQVAVPPLRERSGDIPQIIAEMLASLGRDLRSLSPEAMRLLERHAYPGNLLELAHALMHANALSSGAEIRPEHLPSGFQPGVSRTTPPPQIGKLEPLEVVMQSHEHDYLVQVLRAVSGNRTKAAEILGLSRKGLWQKLKRHGIVADELDGEFE